MQTRGLAPPHHPGWPTKCHLGVAGVPLGKVFRGCKSGERQGAGRGNRNRFKKHRQEGPFQLELQSGAGCIRSAQQQRCLEALACAAARAPRRRTRGSRGEKSTPRGGSAWPCLVCPAPRSRPAPPAPGTTALPQGHASTHGKQHLYPFYILPMRSCCWQLKTCRSRCWMWGGGAGCSAALSAHAA